MEKGVTSAKSKCEKKLSLKSWSISKDKSELVFSNIIFARWCVSRNHIYIFSNIKLMSKIKLLNFLKMALFYLGFMYIPYEVKTMILCISSVEVSKFEISKKIFLKWLKKFLKIYLGFMYISYEVKRMILCFSSVEVWN